MSSLPSNGGMPMCGRNFPARGRLSPFCVARTMRRGKPWRCGRCRNAFHHACPTAHRAIPDWAFALPETLHRASAAALPVPSSSQNPAANSTGAIALIAPMVAAGIACLPITRDDPTRCQATLAAARQLIVSQMGETARETTLITGPISPMR